MLVNLYKVLCFLLLLLLQACNSEESSIEGLNNLTHPITATAVPRTEKWWVDRHNKIIQLDKTNFEILFLGDSITQSWEDENYGLSIWLENFGETRALNLGFSGDGTQHLLWRIENGELDGANPEFVILMIGTNNAKNDSSEDIAEGVNAILSVIEAKLPNSQIVVHRIFPRGFASEPLRQITNKASDIFSDNATRENIVYLDINDHFTDELGNIPIDIMYDGLHLTTNGYVIWANAFAHLFTK